MRKTQKDLCWCMSAQKGAWIPAGGGQTAGISRDIALRHCFGRGHSRKKVTADYSAIFGRHLVRLAKENEKIVAISPAMAPGSGLLPFSRNFPEQFFDVGICEAHAVTSAAGLAISGFIPVVAIYSSFYSAPTIRLFTMLRCRIYSCVLY